jgi:vancomycin resistance protein YoaR
VDAVIKPSEPSVSDTDARVAVRAARAAVSRPITVRATDSAGTTVTAVLPPRAISAALSYSVEDGAFVPKIDGAVLHQAIAKQLKSIEVPGNDATFQIVNDVPQVVPSTTGNGVSDDDLAAAVEAVVRDPGAQREVSVQISTRPPRITTEEAAALGITEKMSTFTQRFPYAPYRVQNIGEAARHVNGTLLLPGETFSMNDTIGERTVKNGYTTGYVVGPGGIFTEDLGGGVSTATTATWTAAFFAGLERVSTTAHSIYISRYRAGLEATVAWGNFDMKFKNNTPNGVYITATTTRTSVTVTFWGKKQYDEIKADSHPRMDVKPYVTLIDTSPKCHAQGGEPGFSITVDRVFIKGGDEVKREPITTYYKPGPEVKCEKPSKAALAAAASASAAANAVGEMTPPGEAAGQGPASPSVSPSPSRKR